MLKKIRVILASVLFVLCLMLFLDFTGFFAGYFGWIAKIQFVPAVLAVNLIVVAALVLLTFVFGRVYCSVVCPLGIFQDLISSISSKRKGFNARFGYSKELKWLRYLLLVVFVATLIAGIPAVYTLIEPYSSFGRIANSLFSPVYQWVNNAFAYLAERVDSYAFYHKEVLLKGVSTLVVASVSLVLIFVLAWKKGRIYCNSVCPVGTVLGLISKIALFRPVLDKSKCTSCKQCAKKCKSSCIDIESGNIDYSRCVVCFDCLSTCKFGALEYKFAYGKRDEQKDNSSQSGNPENISRRGFLAVTGVVAASVAAKGQHKVDGGLAPLEDKQIPQRNKPIVPPGAVSLEHLSAHCTACQLCVSACPNNVLRPSDSLERFMQPESSYEKGFCRPECNKCSQVCPNGAIKPLAVEDKVSTHIGHAVWVQKNCLPASQGASCGLCARRCPVGAITMVQLEGAKDGVMVPSVDTEKCIGCGACEYYCPSRPYSAIYVEGNDRQFVK